VSEHNAGKTLPFERTVTSHTTKTFRKLQAGLPKEIQKECVEGVSHLRQKSSPSQPSIQESSLDTSDISVRVGRAGAPSESEKPAR